MTDPMKSVLRAVAMGPVTRQEAALFVALWQGIPASETERAIDEALAECQLQSWEQFVAMLKKNASETE